ncbi:MAG TPA: hypothetical protein VM328_08495 [Fimbriimonadaceae bacterium]|nr:hypothetical protein [Fimbriimonadaceae bacterium]
MRKRGLGTSLWVLPIAVSAFAAAQLPTPPAKARFVDSYSGVPIICEVDTDMFPTEWRTREINALAAPLHPGQIERSIEITRRALRKYPRRVLKTNLLKIYIARKISFYGLEFGGTNSVDRVFMSNDGILRGYTEEYIERMFHHEFSSILLRNYPNQLNRREWDAANPPGFRYSGDGVQALRDRADSTAYEEAMHRRGFLCQYAMSSFEEDFNTIAEGLFSGGAAFWSAVDRHPQLRRKTRVAIAFYSKLDGTFTESRFRSFAL